MTQTGASLRSVLDAVAEQARAAGVFGEITVTDDRLECGAAASAEPAFYRVEADGDRLWVSLVMKDRWQSESIESDLMHSGDSLEELLEEELAEQGYTGAALPFEHFRSDDMLFTFRSPLPVKAGTDEAAGVVSRCLLAYEACFAALGDMSADENED